MIKRRCLDTGSCLLVPLLALLISAQAQAHQSPQPELPTVELRFGSQVVTAEVARTPMEQERGLMFRTSLKKDNGMLFVFKKDQAVCFWMRNTPLPLSIAFMNDEGNIISIQDMAPETDTGHCSGKPARYALEMAQGWFAAKDVTFGGHVTGLSTR